MRRRVCQYLYDVVQAARHLGRFVQGKTYVDYDGDILLRSAVERQFTVIGEALAQLARLAPDMAARIPDYQQIIGFRNRIIHGYALVDNRVVWDILQHRLSALRAEAQRLLAELDPDYHAGGSA